MKHGHKMPYFVGFLLLILLLIGWVGNSSVNKVAQLTEDLYEHPLAVSTAVLRIYANVIIMHRAMKDIVLTDSQEAAAPYRKIVDQTEEKVLADFRLVEERFLGDLSTEQAARDAFLAWSPIRGEVLRLVSEGKRREAAILSQTISARQVEEVETKINALRDFARNKSQEFLASAQKTRSQTAGFVWFTLCAAVLLAGFVAYKAILLETNLQELNTDMDQKVQLRTTELTRATESLAAANEELRTQQEEITAMNEELTAQNEEMTAMNEEVAALNENLTGMNEELEQRVDERTADLAGAHQELTAQYEELVQSQDSLRHSAEIQDVLRKIAEAALLSPSLNEMYATVHHLVEKVLPAGNMYISLLDEAKGQIVRPYCVDESKAVLRTRPVGKGLTEYFMRMGRTVHVTAAAFKALRESGEVDLYYAPIFECIGVPMRDSHEKIFGVITIYVTEEMQPFEEEDSIVMTIVASQVAMAIERKQAEEALRESELRFKELHDASFGGITIHEQGIIAVCNEGLARMTGFSSAELVGMAGLRLIAPDWRELVMRNSVSGFEQAYDVEGLRKDGSIYPMRIQGRNVLYRGRRARVTEFRDITEHKQAEEALAKMEARREQELHRDAQLATRVQNALLSAPDESDYLQITTVCQPFGYVGGDLYFLDWRYGGNLLRGFLVDAAGHGLSTALHTASLHVLLREVNERDLPLSDAMRWLNRRVAEYFDEGIFAGALGFELDLQTRELRWVCAGIPKIMVATRKKQGALECPGMCLGISVDETFETHMLTVDVGDSLYFMTDGLAGVLGQQAELPLERYPEMVELLQTLSKSESRRDDATAVCLYVRSLPQSLVRQDGWPRLIRFNGYGDYQRLKGEVAKILAEVTGLPHSLQEVAVHEALANAMECRDGVPRQHKARLRFNKVGGRLIVRVKTSRIGFAGNAVLRRLRQHPEEMFSFGEDASMGRGIPMMLSMSHKMIYNSEGTEVLLAWKL